MFDESGKARKPQERRRARELRRQGWPYRRIARELANSPSSALYWTQDIELTTEQRLAVTQDGIRSRAAACSETCRSRRRGYQEHGRERARDGDPIHQAMCMLYWAEGTKHQNDVAFANSDNAMLRFFTDALRTEFDLTDDDFRLRINVYLGNGLSQTEVEDFWLEALRLPRSCLRAGVVDHFPTSSSGGKRAKLPHGVCTLKVARSTAIIQHIYGAIQEYAGFEEPRWLG